VRPEQKKGCVLRAREDRHRLQHCPANFEWACVDCAGQREGGVGTTAGEREWWIAWIGDDALQSVQNALGPDVLFGVSGTEGVVRPLFLCGAFEQLK
jgi:hypothetical protein